MKTLLIKQVNTILGHFPWTTTNLINHSLSKDVVLTLLSEALICCWNYNQEYRILKIDRKTKKGIRVRALELFLCHGIEKIALLHSLVSVLALPHEWRTI